MRQRLWHTRIYGIHTHVVTIIGTPSQGKFAKVARTNDKSVHLITQIHQNLRTLTRLCVLISRIVYLWIMTNILKMLQNRGFNINLTNRDTKTLHECHSILIGSACCSEPWHGNAYNSLTIKSKLIKGLDNDKEGKGGIKSTANTNNCRFAISMYQPLRQSTHLNIIDFIASILHILCLRNKRMLVELACQRKLTHRLERWQAIYVQGEFINLTSNTS